MNWIRSTVLFALVLTFTTAVVVAAESPELPSASVYLKFDGDLRDASGNGHDATFHVEKGTGPLFQRGVFGEGLDLTGDDGYVAVNRKLPEQGTIALWYFVEPYYKYQTIFDNSLNPDAWELWIYDSGLLRFRNDGTRSAVVQHAFHRIGDIREWHHIALTWNRDDKSDGAVRLYIDGEAQDRSGWNYPSWSWTESGDTLYLGGSQNKRGNGIWDDFAIFDEPLSESQISQVYHLGVEHLNLVAQGASMAAQSKTQLVAHRGASYNAPENTMAAFQLAWEEGADAIEGDFYLSKDGKIVCIHDGTTKRTAGVDKRVVDQTLAELKQLDAGSWKAPKFKGEPIPTIEEVLACVPDDKKLLIEIKCGPEIVPELKRVLAASTLRPEQTVVISFGWDVILEVKKELPQLKALWLKGLKRDIETGGTDPALPETIENLKRFKVDGFDVNANDTTDETFAKSLRDAGLEFHVWTVDSPETAFKMISLGVDSITTNRPAWLRKQTGL